MESSFSSLERLKIDKNASTLKYIDKLINDLTNLLNEPDFYDVEIKVGAVQGDVKTFKSHSTILRARSSYFKVALSNNWIKRSEDDIILFEKENISPKVFEVLLTYIYNGVINIDNLDPYEIFKLIEACDELNFDELVDYLQSHLIIEKKEWIEKNLIYVYKNSSKNHLSFSLLLDHCNRLICNLPELFFKSNDFKDIENTMLITILKKDALKEYEVVIWDYVIQWGMRQVERLVGGEGKDEGEGNTIESGQLFPKHKVQLEKSFSEWNQDNITELKNILEDVIPYIRFNEISRVEFYNKIRPYEKVFNRDTYNELIQYYFTDIWPPSLMLQKGPRPKQRKLLNLKMKFLISSWINEKNNILNLPYEFKLIFQGARDGYTRSTFENRCHNIEQTIAIVKIKETGELVGSYNPVCWNIKERSSDTTYYIETNKSFIFKVDGNNVKLSRVSRPKIAIIHIQCRNINFRVDPIEFRDNLIGFGDLRISNSIDDVPYCYYQSFFMESAYRDLNLRCFKKAYVHLIEDFEIYKLVKD